MRINYFEVAFNEQEEKMEKCYRKKESQYKNIFSSWPLIGTAGCSIPWDSLKSPMECVFRLSREERWRQHGPLIPRDDISFSEV